MQALSATYEAVDERDISLLAAAFDAVDHRGSVMLFGFSGPAMKV
jgi:hypothetical protein